MNLMAAFLQIVRSKTQSSRSPCSSVTVIEGFINECRQPPPPTLLRSGVINYEMKREEAGSEPSNEVADENAAFRKSLSSLWEEGEHVRRV